MEAAGIEPASRGTSVQASTCVACRCWPADALRLRGRVRPSAPRQACGAIMPGPDGRHRADHAKWSGHGVHALQSRQAPRRDRANGLIIQ